MGHGSLQTRYIAQAVAITPPNTPPTATPSPQPNRRQRRQRPPIYQKLGRVKVKVPVDSGRMYSDIILFSLGG